MNDAMIRLDNVTFTYQGGDVIVPLFDGFNLTVQEGEVVAVLGPSGCGKTTLLHLIAGLLRPDAGQVRVRGEDPALHRGRLPLAFAFHATPLLPHRTLLENVALPCELRGLDDPHGRARAALAEVGLRGFERYRPSQLSAGMRARAGFAAAVAMEPTVLLLDEPHGALDAISREVVSRIIRDGLRRTGRRMTVVLATHNESEACTVADRCLVLSAARPVEVVGRLETATAVDVALAKLHRMLSEAARTPVTLVVSPDRGAQARVDQALERWPSSSAEVRVVERLDELSDLRPRAVVCIGVPSAPLQESLLLTAGDRLFALVDGAEALPDGWKPVRSVMEGLARGAGGRLAPHSRHWLTGWGQARIVPGLLWVAVLLLVWVLGVSVFNVERFLLPPPADVARFAWAHLADLAGDLVRTTLEALYGLLLAVAVALSAGVAMDRYVFMDRIIWPTFVASQAVPLLAIAPVLHILVPGTGGIVVMTALVCFFPVAVSFRVGLKQARREEAEMFALYARRWRDTFLLLRVPRALSSTLSGLRTAAPIAVVGSIIAELTGTDRGIGKNLLMAVKKVEPELLFTSLMLATLLGFAFYGAALMVEWILIPPSHREGGQEGGQS